MLWAQRGKVYQSHCGCWTIRDDFLEEVKITFPFWLFIKSNTSNEQLYSDPRMETLALFFFSLVLMEMISQNDW